MIEVDKSTVVVQSGEELKNVLEQSAKYNYIYLASDILQEEEIALNEERAYLVIDGTYQSVRHTYTVTSESTDCSIKPSAKTQKITLKNMDIVSSNINGVVYCPVSLQYIGVLVEYNNIKYNGVELTYCPYSKVRVIDSTITIETTNSVSPQEAIEAATIELGGNTNITNTATNYALFTYRADVAAPKFKVLACSRVILTSDSKEFMQGTNRLNFVVSHDADVTLTTGNGFSSYTIHGVQNATIDKNAKFTFIEKSHLRVPMWTIYGTFTVNEGAEVAIINTYTSTPTDNYNLHFKGSACKLILNNPKSFILYTPNANVIYTNSPLEYTFKVSRVNMWTNSVEFQTAGSITNVPDYSWYKEEDLFEVSGVLSSTDTTVTTHNLTEEELNYMPALDSFKFQTKKQFSVGKTTMNIQPINSTSTAISGYAVPFSDVLISCDGMGENVSADSEGYFTSSIASTVQDGTEVEITVCLPASFVYTTRTITTPFDGELSLMDMTNSVEFELTGITGTSVILPRKKPIVLKVADSRVVSEPWKLYASISEIMASVNGFMLPETVVFKKFDDDYVVLSDTPQVVYTGSDNEGNYAKLHTITWSEEKGVLLSLEDEALEANEEYMTNVLWSIE